jgi:hypothetical protein
MAPVYVENGQLEAMMLDESRSSSFVVDGVLLR